MLNSPHAMLKMCPLKNTACVIDLGYLFELAKWISWIFVASFESTPILNQTHTLLKDLIWHLTILYINIPLFFLNQHNPPKSCHRHYTKRTRCCWCHCVPALSFAWAWLIGTDLYPAISWAASRTLQVQLFENIPTNNLTSLLWRKWMRWHLREWWYSTTQKDIFCLSVLAKSDSTLSL